MLASLVCFAPFAGAAPTGVYVVVPQGEMNTPKMRDISALPFVDGFYLEIDWASVEPSRDNFDWAFLDRQIEAVANDRQKGDGGG